MGVLTAAALNSSTSGTTSEDAIERFSRHAGGSLRPLDGGEPELGLPSTRLFAAWDAGEKTTPLSMRRVCTLQIKHVSVLREMEPALPPDRFKAAQSTSVVLAVSLKGARGTVRSDQLPLNSDRRLDAAMDLSMTLQYVPLICSVMAESPCIMLTGLRGWRGCGRRRCGSCVCALVFWEKSERVRVRPMSRRCQAVMVRGIRRGLTVSVVCSGREASPGVRVALSRDHARLFCCALSTVPSRPSCP